MTLAARGRRDRRRARPSRTRTPRRASTARSRSQRAPRARRRAPRSWSPRTGSRFDAPCPGAVRPQGPVHGVDLAADRGRRRGRSGALGARSCAAGRVRTAASCSAAGSCRVARSERAWRASSPAPDTTALTPSLDARLVGSGVVGAPLRVVARLRPAGAGRLAVRAMRGGKAVAGGTFGSSARVRLPSGAPGVVSVRVAVVAAAGYAAPRATQAHSGPRTTEPRARLARAERPRTRAPALRAALRASSRRRLVRARDDAGRARVPGRRGTAADRAVDAAHVAAPRRSPDADAARPAELTSRSARAGST